MTSPCKENLGVVATHTSQWSSSHQVLLMTCQVRVTSPDGHATKARVFVEEIWNLNCHPDNYPICVSHIFSFSFLFVLFRLCQGLISANSVRQVWVSWLYNETPAQQKSSYHLPIVFLVPIVSFRGGLSSEYQVVKNQWTPLLIVQIVLNLVACHSTPVIHIFVTNVVLVASIAHNFKLNSHLPLR